MKIIILGAGQVGGTLAEHLANEKNDIVVVDTDSERLRNLKDRLDIAVISGQASHPDVLARAGANDAEMIVAVTNSDEINMMACQIAHTLFNTPRKISRVRSPSYLLHQERLFKRESIPVDVIIGPEQLITDSIRQLIINPGALQVMDFADGRVQLVAVRGTGRLLAATVVAPDAAEMLPLLTAAQRQGTSLWRLSRLEVPYPALGEAIRKAADAFVFASLPRLHREAGAYLRWRWRSRPAL